MTRLFPPMKMVIEAERTDAKCAFYDTELQKWSEEGVETLEDPSLPASYIACTTRHLSIFGGKNTVPKAWKMDENG